MEILKSLAVILNPDTSRPPNSRSNPSEVEEFLTQLAEEQRMNGIHPPEDDAAKALAENRHRA